MLFLASRSPRRNELLARLRVPFSVRDVDVPEVRAAGEGAVDYVRRVAMDKARAGLASLGDAGRDAWVLGSDTEVILDDAVFGKPEGPRDAAAMLARLSGRTHSVVTVVALVSATRELVETATSEVTFASLTDADIAGYVASGEPEGRAGAYAIQGDAERFVSRLSGSYSGVMGLPLHETARLLVAAGFAPAFGERAAGHRWADAELAA